VSTVREALTAAITFLEAGKIAGARLDAELLLAHVLRRDRAWLLAHDDEELTPHQAADFEAFISRRSEHVPVVHLTGHRDFYGLAFAITPDVLIDIGTGSGAIAIAIGAARPDLSLTGTEITDEALTVAHRNAKQYDTKIELIKADLWDGVSGTFATIVTNLPYLRDDADLMPEVRKEPAVALFGGPDGLDLYRRFVAGIAAHLTAGGYLFTECDPWQHEALMAEAAKVGLAPIEQGYFILGFQGQ